MTIKPSSLMSDAAQMMLHNDVSGGSSTSSVTSIVTTKPSCLMPEPAQIMPHNEVRQQHQQHQKQLHIWQHGGSSTSETAFGVWVKSSRRCRAAWSACSLMSDAAQIMLHHDVRQQHSTSRTRSSCVDGGRIMSANSTMLPLGTA